ncbi:late embryogenesis abundant protein Lea14-A-like [Cornus florida]|uniref:late embryogenesis abundant protein Lea14-A-like n=1 Tax=Cornus florida TaxID=4283 RepID=UPI00289F50F8|nr:late embryogenesis abundant protein Lea14-A-like [Cornus florida]
MASLLGKAKNFVAEKLGDVAKPEAEVLDVDLKDVSRECISYHAKVSVTNPYSVSIPICKLSYSFKSTGREIASGTMPDPGSLNGNETTVLDVLLEVPHNVLATLVKDIGADWDIDYELELRLTMDLPVIGEFTIPLNKKGAVKLPTLSDLFT